ncbi:MAG: carbohydrate ABC transporter permease [Clostridiales bacterium]|nr:carbohydrate ABC transporter permease [Clostridiales bacterium]
MYKKNKVTKWIVTIIMLVIGVMCIYPFIFMLSSSFKPSGDVLMKPFELIPSNFTLKNITGLFNSEYYNFPLWYWNTILMTGITLLLKLFLITLTAYGFSKIQFKGRDAIFLVLLAALMIPSDIMILPRYIIFKNLKLLNTMWAIIIPSCVDVYFVFLLRQSFISIPDSISEAAKIDGCNHFKIYYSIIVPLAKPAIATMMLFSFVWTWNDYMSPYLYISDIKKQMLSVGIKLFSSGQVQDYGAQMAAATLVLLPIIVMFLFCQRYFVEGVTSSGVKG